MTRASTQKCRAPSRPRSTCSSARGASARRHRPAACRSGDSRVLPDRHGRSELQPGAIRRRPLRIPRSLRLRSGQVDEGREELHRMYARTRARGFGPEVKRRIMLGTYVLSAGYYDAYYLKAQQVRTLIRSDYDRAFDRVDVVAMPTSPTPAFTIGERASDPAADVPGRRLHREREPGRPASDQRSLRVHVRSAADRTAADRARVRRSDAGQDRRRLRTRHLLVLGAPGHLTSSNPEILKS